MRLFGLTHVGNVRETNEDSIYMQSSDPCYVVVADGMGGHAAGEVASSLAISAVRSHIDSLGRRELDGDELIDAVQYANRRIIEASDQNRDYSGMGTTLTLAYLQPASILVAHVGDSQAWLRRGGRIRKVTKDHTYIQRLVDTGVLKPGKGSAWAFPFQNVITRALGREDTRADLYRESWSPGDSLLVCSDGLTAYAEQERILEELSRPTSIEDQARSLLSFALAEGGRDNISVIIAQNDGSAHPAG